MQEDNQALADTSERQQYLHGRWMQAFTDEGALTVLFQLIPGSAGPEESKE